MTDLILCTTIKRQDLDNQAADCDVVIHFECDHYTPGTRHSHPGGHWNSHIGSWDPPDDPEAEFTFIRAEFDGGEPDDAPGPLTEVEIEGLRTWFDAHGDEALDAYIRQENV